MGQEQVEYTYNGKPFREDGKEGNTETRYNRREAQKQYTK